MLQQFCCWDLIFQERIFDPVWCEKWRNSIVLRAWRICCADCLNNRFCASAANLLLWPAQQKLRGLTNFWSQRASKLTFPHWKQVALAASKDLSSESDYVENSPRKLLLHIACAWCDHPAASLLFPYYANAQLASWTHKTKFQ